MNNDKVGKCILKPKSSLCRNREEWVQMLFTDIIYRIQTYRRQIIANTKIITTRDKLKRQLKDDDLIIIYYKS